MLNLWLQPKEKKLKNYTLNYPVRLKNPFFCQVLQVCINLWPPLLSCKHYQILFILLLLNKIFHSIFPI